MLSQWVDQYLLWFVLAALLLGAEALRGGFSYLAAGVAALVVGTLHYLYPYVGVEIQLLFFLVIAAGLIWVTRSYLADRAERQRQLHDVIAQKQYVGREFALVSPISEGVSSLNIDGVVWQLRGEDAPAGSRVRIVAMGEGTLQVEPVQQAAPTL